MVRMDVNPDVRDICYRNESLLPSSAISIITSYIDERILKEILHSLPLGFPFD